MLRLAKARAPNSAPMDFTAARPVLRAAGDACGMSPLRDTAQRAQCGRAAALFACFSFAP